jgi:hypothetical protein
MNLFFAWFTVTAFAAARVAEPPSAVLIEAYDELPAWIGAEVNVASPTYAAVRAETFTATFLRFAEDATSCVGAPQDTWLACPNFFSVLVGIMLS